MEDCDNIEKCNILQNENIYYKADKIFLSERTYDFVWNLGKKINIENKNYLSLCDDYNCEYFAKELDLTKKSDEYIKKIRKEYKKIPNFYAFLQNENKAIIIFKNTLFTSDYSILNNLSNPITQKLIETFNTNIIDKMNIFYRLKLYSEVFVNKEKNILTKLIYNHYINQKPKVEYIAGPYTISHLYSNEYNINIYLFGEYHSETIDCVDKNYEFIQDYLEKLLDTTDVFLDMYFEFPGFIGNKYEKEFPIKKDLILLRLFKKFYNCIESISRKSKKCELGRVHYVDVRTILSEENIEDDISWLINLIGRNKKVVLKDLIFQNKTRIQQIFKQMLNSYNLKEYFVNTLFSNKHIVKEIKKSYLGYIISNYISEEIKSMLKQYDDYILELVQNINYDLFSLGNYNYQKLKELLHSLLPLNALFMDTYTLCRIFREFKVEDIFSQPKKPQNIIYYSGSAHTAKIEKFLISIGFNIIEKVNKDISDNENLIKLEYKNCLNMKNIKQPLFNI